MDESMKKYSRIIVDIASRLPIWAWMILAAITGMGSHVFLAEMTFNGYLSSYSASLSTFIVMLAFMGVAYAVLARIGARIIFTWGSKTFYRKNANVPDYALRRFPFKYSLFLAIFLMAACVYNLFALALNLLIYASASAYYVWNFLSNVVRIGTFAAVWFALRPLIPAWQLKNAFVSLALPSALVLILCVLGGI